MFGDKGVKMTNSTLYLNNVNLYTSGNYSCTAVNQEGRGQSKDIYIKVKRESNTPYNKH